MRRNIVGLGSLLVLLLVTAPVGCASTDSVRTLETRAEAHERRLSAVEADLRRVDKTADAAVQRAEAAESEAKSAAESADAAARKAEAIFTKSVRK